MRKDVGSSRRESNAGMKRKKPTMRKEKTKWREHKRETESTTEREKLPEGKATTVKRREGERSKSAEEEKRVHSKRMHFYMKC
eukprot:6204888-Pleurochrysis_carterae.AAC.5